MSSKNANTEQKPEIHLDPSQYGYAQGQKAPFEGNLVLNAIGVLHAFALKEQTVIYEPNESFEATVKTGKTQITEMGLQALRLVELLTEEHAQNADEGVAAHQSVLMKNHAPKFEVPVADQAPSMDEAPAPSVESEQPVAFEPDFSAVEKNEEGN